MGKPTVTSGGFETGVCFVILHFSVFRFVSTDLEPHRFSLLADGGNPLT